MNIIAFAIIIIFTIVISVVTIQTVVKLIKYFYNYGVDGTSIGVSLFCLVLVIALIIFTYHFVNDMANIINSQKTETVQHVYIDD